MKNIEQIVAQHYGATNLLARIVAGLEATGADLNNLQCDDLTPIEEFHIGGRSATEYAISKMSLHENQHVLDVGCGIGGTARYIAKQKACKVTGIDLTPEYISIANSLTKLTRLTDKVSHHVCSALSMHFDAQTFDAAITIHVAMNIPDRVAFYAEIARVMKPGAQFCIFDVMKKSDDNLVFPVPWAQSSNASHLTTPDEMRTLLENAGFSIQEVEDRTDFALDFFRESKKKMAKGPQPLGIHLMMGDTAAEKFKNVADNIEEGRISPVQIIATRLMS